MDSLQLPDYDYHFSHNLCHHRFDQKKPGSWAQAQVLTTTEDDDEHFGGFRESEDFGGFRQSLMDTVGDSCQGVHQ